MSITLGRLEGLYWVARTGGFARAARAFPYPVTAAAVHQQVRKLEQEVGARLVERAGRGEMRLTGAGQTLYAHVAPFYERLTTLARSLSAGELAGELRVQATALLVRELLPGWLRRLRSLRPGIEIRLTEAAAGDLRLLRSYDMDLIVDYVSDVPPEIGAQRVGAVIPHIVVARSHRCAKLRRATLRSFAGETFIAYTPDRSHYEGQRLALRTYGVEPPSTLYATTSEAILGMVEAGLGFSIVPAIAGGKVRTRGVASWPLDTQGIAFPVYALWRRSEPPNPLVEAALACAPQA